MPYHLGPIDAPNASFWTDVKKAVSDLDGHTVGADSLSLFPDEYPVPAPPPAETRARSRPEIHRGLLDPMLVSMQDRIQTLNRDMDQLRVLAGQIAAEYRRLEFASQEAARFLEERRSILRHEQPIVVETQSGTVPLTELVEPPLQPMPFAVTHRRSGNASIVQWTIRVRVPHVVTAERVRRAAKFASIYAKPIAALAVLAVGGLLLMPALRNDTGPERVGALPSVTQAAELIAAPRSPAPSRSVPAPNAIRSSSRAVPLVAPAAPVVRTVSAPVKSLEFRGTLAVKSEPAGAAVIVNGEYRGETPLQVPGLRAGSHVIWIEGQGYRKWTGGVLVPADKVTEISVKMERQPGSDR
jgi:hypothetical protein